MIDRFLQAHRGPGSSAVGDGALERFALQAFLCGKLDAAELMQERLVAGAATDPIRVLVLALLSRLHAGHPRGSGGDLIAEVESILAGVPENLPAGFDATVHRQALADSAGGIVAMARKTLADLSLEGESFAPLVGAPKGDPLPLICLEDGTFSFARLHAAQRDLVERIAARVSEGEGIGEARIAQALGVVDALPGHALHADQRDAVELSLRCSFLVLTGGPGTGKTTVVSRILLALAHAMEGFDPESVALCAPTGRAKSRLADSIGQNLAPLCAGDPIAAALVGVPAATLHSLLGARPDGTFRHGPAHPLPHKVVVLDEASMVDLPLFAAFLSALSPAARLVVVGDPDQLPSVDAGAVLADLVHNPHLRKVRAHLTHTHRNAGDIAEICRTVRQADDAGAWLARHGRAVAEMPLARHSDGGVVHLEGAEISDVLGRWLEERFGEPMRELFREQNGFADPTALSELVDRSRVLCAVHEGKGGTLALNALGDAWLRERFPSSWRGRFAPGQQVILTRNHPMRDLWNGDLGVVVEEQSRLVAAFAKSRRTTTVPVEQLDGLESAWAITVHKAQGSEFDEVLFVLPDRDSPVLTRQILYTALSRARRTVFVHGDLDLATKAVSRSADRPGRLRTAYGSLAEGFRADL